MKIRYKTGVNEKSAGISPKLSKAQELALWYGGRIVGGISTGRMSFTGKNIQTLDKRSNLPSHLSNLFDTFKQNKLTIRKRTGAINNEFMGVEQRVVSGNGRSYPRNAWQNIAKGYTWGQLVRKRTNTLTA